MARYVVTTPVVIPFACYGSPGRMLRKGDVVELNAAEVTAIGAGNLRTLATPPATFGGSQLMAPAGGTRDTLGTAYAASNATP